MDPDLDLRQESGSVLGGGEGDADLLLLQVCAS